MDVLESGSNIIDSKVWTQDWPRRSCYRKNF